MKNKQLSIISLALLVSGLIVFTLFRAQTKKAGEPMFIEDIVKLAKENNNYRKVISTAKQSQIVLMSIPPGEDIGAEVHQRDQILVFVEGEGIAELDGKKHKIAPGRLAHVPAGTKHNFINTGSKDLKLYTIYAPPEHKEGIVRKTKKEAQEIPE